MAKFVNPYNFIPLKGKSRSLAGDSGEKKFSGRIIYTMETITPLFIPNTSNDRVFTISNESFTDENGEEVYHPSFDFFSYNDLDGKSDQDDTLYGPVIPGSEIRGAFRSIYEAMTNSCLSAADEAEPIAKRTPEQYKQGIIRNDNGSWRLYGADDYIVRDSSNFANKVYSTISEVDGTAVSFSKITVNGRPPYAKPLADLSGTSLKGYLVKGIEGPKLPRPRTGARCRDCPAATQRACREAEYKRCYLIEKHNAHIFMMRGKALTALEKEKAKRQIDSVLIIYRNRDKQAYQEYAASWEAFKAGKSDGIPVYYSEVTAGKEKKYYLSPACITREVYENTLKKILGEHSKCEDEEKLCPSCSLFGTVNTKKNFSRTSRIRFSDAQLVGKKKEEVFHKIVTLPELSGPKISATEMYLTRPDIKNGVLLNWTYDYYIYADHDNIPHVVFYQPTIAGRKFYWHHDIKKVRHLLAQPQETTKRNKTIRPVNSNVSFQGKVYFDDISEKELKQLIAILNMSGNDSGYALHIGNGKPFGLGSVNVTVDEVNLRKLSIVQSKIVYESNASFGTDINDIKISDNELFEDTNVLNILDTSKVSSETVMYPVVDPNDDEEEGFTWYTVNRKAYKMSRANRHNPTERLQPAWDNSPRSRRQTFYVEYLKALNPFMEEQTTLEEAEHHAHEGQQPKQGNASPTAGNGGREASPFKPQAKTKRKASGRYKGTIDIVQIKGKRITSINVGGEWITVNKLKKLFPDGKVPTLKKGMEVEYEMILEEKVKKYTYFKIIKE